MQFPKLENYLMTEKAHGEAPKRRGRPPMTEEQKAANKAAREAAGASAAAGTKTVPKQAREGKPDRVVTKGITQPRLVALLRQMSTAQADMDEAKGTMGGLVTAAVEKDHLHKKAFGWIKGLWKADPAKRMELLYHFDLMRDHLGWNKTDDLLRTDGVDVGHAPPPDEEQEPYDAGDGDDGIPYTDSPQEAKRAAHGFTGEDLNEGRVVGFPRST